MILTDQKTAEHKPAQETPDQTPITEKRNQSRVPILQCRKPSRTPACPSIMSDGAAHISQSNNSPNGNFNM
jgi:hypothetical protein